MYYEIKTESLAISPNLLILFIASILLAAIVMFLQGIINISQSKNNLNGSGEARQAKRKLEAKEVKKKKEETKEETPTEQEGFRRIGSSVKVLK